MANSIIDRELIDSLQRFVVARVGQRENLREERPVEASSRKGFTYSIPEEPRSVGSVVDELTNEVLPCGARTEHPRFFGFIPGPASIASWVGDTFATAANLHGAATVNAPEAVAAERATLRWLAERIGYGPQAGGDFVSGGSMANLTALTAARDRQLGQEDWSRAVAYISVETHSSIVRALSVIGVTDSRVRRIRVDEQFRMIPSDLEAMIAADRANGFAPFVVVATAGTTNTGAVDPLREIAAISRANDLWLHVDGAFGASVLVSEKHRSLLDGVELSDSLSWDAHKWMFQTYGLGVVMVRDQADLLRSFHVSPEYLDDIKADIREPNPSDIGIELTRPTRGLKLWFTLQVHGSTTVGAWIDRGIATAETFQRLLVERPNWKIVSNAALGILTFRYAPSRFSEYELDVLNKELSERMLAEGFAAIYTTTMLGQKVLRVAAINPETTLTDLTETISRLDSHAVALMAQCDTSGCFPQLSLGGGSNNV